MLTISVPYTCKQLIMIFILCLREKIIFSTSSLLKFQVVFTAEKHDNPVPATKCNRNMMNITHVVETLMKDYDKHLLPDADGVNVTMEIHIQDVSSIYELTGDFELDLMYSEIWKDSRLDYSNLSICAKNITFKSQFRDRLWNPDTCIINSKSAEMHKSPSENTFVIVYDDGVVWSNYRMRVKAPCRMDLKMFPFDDQECKLVFESYSYNIQEVRLSWHEKPVTFVNPIDLPDFELMTFKTETIRLEYPNGWWDELHVTFVFSRRYGFYLFQAYFPTSLTVISSWVGFFLDTHTVSARITLAVSSLLALTFQFGTVLKHLPRVSYIKCLDVWMISCVAFIFFTLVELVIVSQLAQRDRRREMGAKICQKWLDMVRKKKAPPRKVAPKISLAAPTPPPSSLSRSASTGNKVDTAISEEENHNTVIQNGSTVTASVWKRLQFRDDQAVTQPVNTVVSPILPVRRETDLLLPKFESQNETINARGYITINSTRVSNVRNMFYRFRDLRFRESYRNLRDSWKKFTVTAVMVDKASLFIFPFAFFTFNVVYWSVYFFGFKRQL